MAFKPTENQKNESSYLPSFAPLQFSLFPCTDATGPTPLSFRRKSSFYRCWHSRTKDGTSLSPCPGKSLLRQDNCARHRILGQRHFCFNILNISLLSLAGVLSPQPLLLQQILPLYSPFFLFPGLRFRVLLFETAPQSWIFCSVVFILFFSAFRLGDFLFIFLQAYRLFLQPRQVQSVRHSSFTLWACVGRGCALRGRGRRPMEKKGDDLEESPREKGVLAKDSDGQTAPRLQGSWALNPQWHRSQ